MNTPRRNPHFKVYENTDDMLQDALIGAVLHKRERLRDTIVEKGVSPNYHAMRELLSSQIKDIRNYYKRRFKEEMK